MNRKELEAEKIRYFQQPKIDIVGTQDDPEHWIYRLRDSKVFVREVELDSGLPGEEPAELVVIADVHFNWLNEEDEKNEELLDSQKHRFWNAEAASIPSAIRAMEYAQFFDQTIVVGDTLDFLSMGAMELTEKYIWDVDPETLIALGGHDVTREMQTGKPDLEPLEERYAIVEKLWHHDVYYISKVIRDKVMIIVLDNGQSRYWERQIEPLRRDIAWARERKMPVIVFQHEQVCSHNPEENPLYAIRGGDGNTAYLYDRGLGSGEMDEPTRKVYDLITKNADVVKALVCGHWHGDYLSHVLASYTDENGTVHETQIPQYILTTNVCDDYSGHVMKITVR